MTLSTEAKVVCGTFWGPIMPTDCLSFSRPWVIHPKLRKGLDDLVAAGLLSMAPRNNYPDCPLDWKPTDKMATDKPTVSRKFISENTFPITSE